MRVSIFNKRVGKTRLQVTNRRVRVVKSDRWLGRGHVMAATGSVRFCIKCGRFSGGGAARQGRRDGLARDCDKGLTCGDTRLAKSRAGAFNRLIRGQHPRTKAFLGEVRYLARTPSTVAGADDEVL